MKLAREGWEICAAAAALALLVTFFSAAAALPLWLVVALLLQFFREPARVLNTTPNAVLAAADGRVVFVGAGECPLSGEEVLKISIFMNVFNVHINRAPVAGAVVHSQRFAGKFFNAALDKSSHENERHMIAINTPAGQVVAVQIAGLLARRVLCYAKVGESLSAGQRYGFIRLGSRVDLYLPPACRPQVGLGDKTTAGVSIVALLPAEENAR